ncbi:unnamed protein product [Prorocentrum cordatum]|uniref:Uncharacterized protein n=1 Tax=Prorocentrum cordatum TaxID=2364126 RepID=A0ABN9R7V5_9DINO|nr:unnamed protein product [Polarella glacialis]
MEDETADRECEGPALAPPAAEQREETAGDVERSLAGLEDETEGRTAPDCGPTKIFGATKVLEKMIKKQRAAGMMPAARRWPTLPVTAERRLGPVAGRALNAKNNRYLPARRSDAIIIDFGVGIACFAGTATDELAELKWLTKQEMQDPRQKIENLHRTLGAQDVEQAGHPALDRHSERSRAIPEDVDGASDVDAIEGTRGESDGEGAGHESASEPIGIEIIASTCEPEPSDGALEKTKAPGTLCHRDKAQGARGSRGGCNGDTCAEPPAQVRRARRWQQAPDGKRRATCLSSKGLREITQERPAPRPATPRVDETAESDDSFLKTGTSDETEELPRAETEAPRAAQDAGATRGNAMRHDEGQLKKEKKVRRLKKDDVRAALLQGGGSHRWMDVEMQLQKAFRRIPWEEGQFKLSGLADSQGQDGRITLLQQEPIDNVKDGQNYQLNFEPFKGTPAIAGWSDAAWANFPDGKSTGGCVIGGPANRGPGWGSARRSGVSSAAGLAYCPLELALRRRVGMPSADLRHVRALAAPCAGCCLGAPRGGAGVGTAPCEEVPLSSPRSPRCPSASGPAHAPRASPLPAGSSRAHRGRPAARRRAAQLARTPPPPPAGLPRSPGGRAGPQGAQLATARGRRCKRCRRCLRPRQPAWRRARSSTDCSCSRTCCRC